VLDATTLLQGGRGRIVFDGNKKPQRNRRFWALEKAGTVKFTLVRNLLKINYDLIITGFQTGSYDAEEDEVYTE